MDAEFDRRWRNSQPPFHGLSVTLDECISLPLFQQVMVAIVERLYTFRPTTSLFHNMDWHEHDGVITEAQPISWEKLRSLVASTDTIREHFYLADTYVRDAIFPVERDYLLRFYVDFPDAVSGEPTPPPTGTIDITCERPLALQLEEVMRTVGVSNIDILPAKAFFDAGYTG